MKRIQSLLAALLLCLGAFPTTASAAVIGSYVHDYGNSNGGVAPDRYGWLRGNHVDVRDLGGFNYSDFQDTISFAGLSPNATITSIELELEYDRTNDGWFEDWYAMIGGIGSTTAYFAMEDFLSPQVITLLPGTNAFQQAISNLGVTFSFLENDWWAGDSFRLYSARVRVNGSLGGAVPLPAPFWLLLTALGALVALRRRQTPA